MDEKNPCLVFDVGGTNLRAALYDSETNTISAEMCRITPSHWTLPDYSVQELQKRLFQEMSRMAQGILGNQAPAVVSVAFPGPVDPQGNVLQAPTLWGNCEPFPVLRELQPLWSSSRVFLMNDVTAAGYRYLKHRSDDLCIVTVSSGIGHKVFIAGRAAVGPMGRGGEIGHLKVDFATNAPECDCGGTGHLGAVASGRGVLLSALRRAKRDPEAFAQSTLGVHFGKNLSALDNRALVEAFHAGDSWVCDLIHEAAQPLGRVLAALHLAVGTERFVIVGGFALALGERYRIELICTARESCWEMGQDWNRMILLGEPDDRSGLLGAGRYATVLETRASF